MKGFSIRKEDLNQHKRHFCTIIIDALLLDSVEIENENVAIFYLSFHHIGF